MGEAVARTKEEQATRRTPYQAEPERFTDEQRIVHGNQSMYSKRRVLAGPDEKGEKREKRTG